MSTEHTQQAIADAHKLAADPEVVEFVESLPDVVKEAKSGYKTTEFWLALVGIVATQLSVLELPGEHGQTIATVAIAVAYILSRGVAKAGVPSIPAPSA